MVIPDVKFSGLKYAYFGRSGKGKCYFATEKKTEVVMPDTKLVFDLETPKWLPRPDVVKLYPT